jgi:pre-rRNA-processing protein TSR4
MANRYDMGAVPLPYTSHSELYKRLFNNSKQLGEEDDDDDEGVDAAFRKAYSPKGVVPPCERCGSERTFEMQLVPGLIAELKTEMLSLSGEKKVKKNRKQTEEERKRELAVLLGKASAKDLVKPGEGNVEGETEEDRLKSETGMEWGTVMVFGCENDCVGFGEEWVGVEWEEIQ